jgi:hypothetical protein
MDTQHAWAPPIPLDVTLLLHHNIISRPKREKPIRYGGARNRRLEPPGRKEALIKSTRYTTLLVVDEATFLMSWAVV